MLRYPLQDLHFNNSLLKALIVKTSQDAKDNVKKATSVQLTRMTSAEETRDRSARAKVFEDMLKKENAEASDAQKKLEALGKGEAPTPDDAAGSHDVRVVFGLEAAMTNFLKDGKLTKSKKKTTKTKSSDSEKIASDVFKLGLHMRK